LKIYQLEVTNVCNMKCSFCPSQQDWAKRKYGYMRLKLVDRIDWSKTEYVELQFSGEPLLHKELRWIVEALHEKGLKVGFSTNGLLKSELCYIIESIDCVTVNKDNFREPVFVNKENVFVQSLGKDYPVENYSHKIKVKEYPECETPFNYVSIQWDGDVVPCCKAHGKTVVFGNLYRDSFDRIVFGQKHLDFIDKHRARRDNGLCEYCRYPNPHKIHEKLRCIWG